MAPIWRQRLEITGAYQKRIRSATPYITYCKYAIFAGNQRLCIFPVTNVLLTFSFFTFPQAYTGQRLSQTLNWALSSVGDDVTEYTKGLTELERRLFLSGGTAASNHEAWKVYGNGRLLPMTEHKKTVRPVTPDLHGSGNKRQRIS